MRIEILSHQIYQGRRLLGGWDIEVHVRLARKNSWHCVYLGIVDSDTTHT